jgi:ATP-dependent Lon protease
MLACGTYIKLNKKVPEEVLGMLKEVSDVERFSDIIIMLLVFSVPLYLAV